MESRSCSLNDRRSWGLADPRWPLIIESPASPRTPRGRSGSARAGCGSGVPGRAAAARHREPQAACVCQTPRRPLVSLQLREARLTCACLPAGSPRSLSLRALTRAWLLAAPLAERPSAWARWTATYPPTQQLPSQRTRGSALFFLSLPSRLAVPAATCRQARPEGRITPEGLPRLCGPFRSLAAAWPRREPCPRPKPGRDFQAPDPGRLAWSQ